MIPGPLEIFIETNQTDYHHNMRLSSYLHNMWYAHLLSKPLYQCSRASVCFTAAGSPDDRVTFKRNYNGTLFQQIKLTFYKINDDVTIFDSRVHEF